MGQQIAVWTPFFKVLLLLESTIIELQRATILRYSPHNIVGYASGNVRIDIECDLHV